MDFIRDLFDTTDFPARWHCGQWSEPHGWLHIVSDTAIFGAYMAIPCVLGFFVLRRKDVPYHSIFWLFGAFILACGIGHLLEAIIFWHPVYRLSGLVKLATAVVSWATVVSLVWVVPQALRFPGLAKLNTLLSDEVEERKRVELALRQGEEKLAVLLESEREARNQAEQASHIKDEFLSTVSHELRTPLNAILGYAQLLQHSKAATGEVEDGLSIIERNAKVQAQIIEDLLDVSRIISGKVRLEVEAVDLVHVIDAAVATVRPAAEAKGVRLQTVLDSHSGAVYGDSGRLQQVVWNLLTNAIKYTPRDGRVTIVLERVNSHVELRVTDTGQGISSEFLPYIFDRFRQADPAVDSGKRQSGLGLGLSIVRHLVELHGGSVTASSPGRDQGSTFVVNLPVQPVQPAAAAARRKPDDAATSQLSLSGIKALVVDDDTDSRELIKRLLVERGTQVVMASSVDEALEAFRRDPPDIVLSDIGMPDKDGYDLIRAIRNLSGNLGRVPAVAVTALARAEDRKRAMLAGFQTHISKPVDSGEVIAAVASLTGLTSR